MKGVIMKPKMIAVIQGTLTMLDEDRKPKGESIPAEFAKVKDA
jgi:hypothetical protein